MRNWLVIAALPAILIGLTSASAQERIKLGVLTDMVSGFSAWSGKGSVIAAELAVEDFKAAPGHANYDINVRFADHQNKPDVASSIARQWMSEGVNAILDMPNSAAALAVSYVVRGTDTLLLAAGAATDDPTRKQCSPNTAQWTFDGWSLGHASATAAVKQGGTTWFFITSDYAGGHDLERAATNFVKDAGGQVVGAARPALGTIDFSSFVLQAQASGAKIIGIASGGVDQMNMIKTAGEFGLAQGGQKLVPLSVFITDVHGLGLRIAQGLVFTEAFYWDLNDDTRAFTKRFIARSGGDYPSHVQAGVYSSTLHYLKAVAAVGTTKGLDVMSKMKEMPTDDPLFGKGTLRADGRHVHKMYVVEVKSPEESKGPWDYHKVLSVIPAEEAFRPPSTECYMIK